MNTTTYISNIKSHLDECNQLNNRLTNIINSIYAGLTCGFIIVITIATQLN